MKKLVLFILFFMVASAIKAQSPTSYEMNVELYIKHDHSNDVDPCGSYFDIKFLNSDGEVLFEWYSGLSMGNYGSSTFNRSFYFLKSNPVAKILITSNRYFENGVGQCKHGDGGGTKEIILSPTNGFPCGTINESSAFSGYSASSYFYAQVKPLSNVYGFQIDVNLKGNATRLLLMYMIGVTYDDNSTETIFAQTKSMYSGDNFLWRGFFKTSSAKKVSKLNLVQTYYQFPQQKTQSYSYDIENYNNFLDDTFEEPFNGPGGTINIKYGLFQTPVQTSLSTGTSLPSSNNVTLTVDENTRNTSIGTEFRWRYSIDGSAFQNVPAQFGNGHTLILNGESFFTALGLNWQNYLFSTVRFKAIYRCASPADRETATVTLTHLPSAPGILSVTQTSETCPGSADGKIKIRFNRPLYEFTIGNTPYRENLSVYLNGTNNEFQVNNFEADNSVTIDNRRPGAYAITLLTKFASQAGYSNGENHKTSTNVGARLPISFSPVKYDVHCYNGEDGRISVTAQGGTQDYTAFLVFENDTIKQINLSHTTGNSFTNLKAGTYTMKLKDSNGCDPKTAGVVTTYQRIVNQPLQALFVNTTEAVEPLGFGLTNGRISVRAQYGTMPYTFDWKDVDAGATLTADPPVTEGPSMRSTLSNIGKGKYFVRVQDPNYALVSIRNDVNLRGCFDTLTIFLDEPPLLEVALKEHRFVSCYGYNDGELVAHAKGGRPYFAGQPYHPYQYEWFVLNNNAPVAFGESDSIAVERPSALYRIKVTDRNGIIAWSDDFHLIQPQPLKIGFNTAKLLCNGDTNGTSKALVTGGTQPYRYAWSTDETSSTIENLSEGWYSVIVTDERKCTTFGQTQVEVPDGLEMTPTLKNPTCYQYKDGSILIDTKGGKAPYHYYWQHKEDDDNVAVGLSKGNYTVKVEDDNNCFIERTYSLDEPVLLPVNLGNDKVLCKDQVLNINASIDDPQAQYSWIKDGVMFSTNVAASLTDAGAYSVTVTDSKGCENTDDIKITRDETVISADFAVATRVPRGERVRVANIANPTPEKMEWIVPDGVSILDRKTEYLELTFNNYGNYVIGLRSFQGACEKTEYKTLQSVSRSELPDYQIPDEPYIKQFMVTPNPNDGTFTANVELREPGSFKLNFYSGQGVVLASREVNGQTISNLSFDLTSSISDGIYMLQLITAQGVATVKVMVKK